MSASAPCGSPESRFRPIDAPIRFAGLERGVPHQDRHRDESERSHPDPPIVEAVANGFREPAPASEAHAGCHVLEDDGGSHRE